MKVSVITIPFEDNDNSKELISDDDAKKYALLFASPTMGVELSVIKMVSDGRSIKDVSKTVALAEQMLDYTVAQWDALIDEWVVYSDNKSAIRATMLKGYFHPDTRAECLARVRLMECTAPNGVMQ